MARGKSILLWHGRIYRLLSICVLVLILGVSASDDVIRFLNSINHWASSRSLATQAAVTLGVLYVIGGVIYFVGQLVVESVEARFEAELIDIFRFGEDYRYRFSPHRRDERATIDYRYWDNENAIARNEHR